MSERKPLVLNAGRIQQLRPADTLDTGGEIEELRTLFHQLLISCALQGVEPLFDELSNELEIAMTMEE